MRLIAINFFNRTAALIKSYSNLKMAFSQNDLITFYAKYVSAETLTNLVSLALRNISLFGSSYCSGQLFSRMKNVKAKSRSLLFDEHLSSIPRTATSIVCARKDNVRPLTKSGHVHGL